MLCLSKELHGITSVLVLCGCSCHDRQQGNELRKKTSQGISDSSSFKAIFKAVLKASLDVLSLKSIGCCCRAAMAPFFANQSAGDSYKWMLYGDDDTVFYLDNVLRMLEALDLDPAMPYFLTDHIWFLRSLTEGRSGTSPLSKL